MVNNATQNNIPQLNNQVNHFLSGYAVSRLLRMADFSKWTEWFEKPPQGLEKTIADLKKSGLTPELCQKARLIPLTYFLRQWGDENTARWFIKTITGLSSSKAGGRDLLKEGELLGFPYFSQGGDLLFVRLRAYPPLTFTDDEGKPREVKYLQPVGVPALPYVLPEVWQVANKPHKPLWIVEGEKKALSLVQHGRYAVALSGVWNFRAGENTARAENDLELWSELRAFNWFGRTVYLGFDMDLWTNPQVRMALFELALKLTSFGAVVRVALWDKKLKGIDDFLTQHPDKLDDVEDKARKLVDIVEPEDFDSIVRALAKTELTYERKEQLIKLLARKLEVKPTTLERAVWKKSQEDQELKPAFSEQTLQNAREVLQSDNLVERLLQDLEKLYAGREKEKLLLYLTVASRKVKNLPMNLMVVLQGASSEGKSSLVRTILGLVGSDDYIEISYQSRAYLYYGVNNLSHKTLFLTELEGSSKGLYGLKLAISEGELLVRSVEATKNGLRAINRRIPAYSMSVITTGVKPNLDEELLTRSIVLSLSSDEELRFKALQVKALVSQEEKATVRELWRAVDSLVEPAEVSIPWIDKMVEAMRGKLVQGRYLRDFDKFIGLVMSSALLHQHQRQRDEKGRIIAQREDYELVWNLQELFTETFGGLPRDIDLVVRTLKGLWDRKKEEAEDEGQKVEVFKYELIDELSKLTGKSDRTVRSWIEKAAKAGYVATVGKGKAGARVYLRVHEIPQPEFPFPDPSEIFGNSNTLPHCLINGEALQDNDLNKASEFCPILPYCPIPENDNQETGQETRQEIGQVNKAIGQNEAKLGCLISNIDTQSFDANKAIGQTSTIPPQKTETEQANEAIRQNEAKLGCLISSLDTQDSDVNKAIRQIPTITPQESEAGQANKAIRQNEAEPTCLIPDIDTQSSDTNKAIGQTHTIEDKVLRQIEKVIENLRKDTSIREFIDVMNKVVPPGWSLHWSGGGVRLWIYITFDKKVVRELEFPAVDFSITACARAVQKALTELLLQAQTNEAQHEDALDEDYDDLLRYF